MNNNFEVKYTIRLYDPSLIAELAAQFEKEQSRYKNKNEFFTHIIELGLDANHNERKSSTDAHKDEKDDLYKLLQKIFSYMSVKFKTIYIRQSLFEHLLSSVYNIVIALNNGDTLFPEKIEEGFYDDIPERCKKIIEELMKRYGLS